MIILLCGIDLFKEIRMNKSFIVLALLSFLLLSCDSGLKFENPLDGHNQDSQTERGELGGECYANKTCNSGLVCEEESNTCVKEAEGDTTPTDTGTPEPTDTGTAEPDEDSGDTVPDGGDSSPDNGDSTDDSDSGDSTPDNGDSADDSDTGDSTPDNGDTADLDAEMPDSDNDGIEIPDAEVSDIDYNDPEPILDLEPVYDGDTEPVPDPCDPNPCSGVANSAGVCTATSWQHFSCGCSDGFFWDGSSCRISLGKICTGQEKCYDNSSVITCPASASFDFYGQDAQYSAKCFPQGFRSSPDDVFDDRTGLTWEQPLSSDTYTWAEAGSHCAALNSANYSGISTWRVPNPLELLTIVDNSRYNPAADPIFTGLSGTFWTSKAKETYAYSFSASYGNIDNYAEKSDPYKVLCVSGEELLFSTADDFETSADGLTLRDKRTGLMWQSSYVSGKKWHEALAYCQQQNSEAYAGYTDWRLPNKNELISLLNLDKASSPYSYVSGTPSGWFWSSSTYISSPAYAWGVGFDNGYIGRGSKTGGYNTNGVRCVR